MTQQNVDPYRRVNDQFAVHDKLGLSHTDQREFVSTLPKQSESSQPRMQSTKTTYVTYYSIYVSQVYLHFHGNDLASQTRSHRGAAAASPSLPLNWLGRGWGEASSIETPDIHMKRHPNDAGNRMRAQENVRGGYCRVLVSMSISR